MVLPFYSDYIKGYSQATHKGQWTLTIW